MTLTARQLSKTYGTTRAVHEVSLELHQGETLALLGPSGCGKSTLLRLIAGLEPLTSGQLLLAGRDITHSSPQTRGFGMVFQDYALFPHMTVGQNIAFGIAHLGKSLKQQRVAELLELVGLAGYESRRIHTLSGGEQQRVALARALAPQPAVLLLDEPLSNLDMSLRENLKQELAHILSQLNVRAIYVTHAQDEAFLLADRIAIMNAGTLIQTEAKDSLYFRPVNAWVARFLGHKNIYSAQELRHSPIRQAAVLRSDLIRLQTGTLAAVVQSAKLYTDRYQVLLDIPAWQLRVHWEGYRRELPPDIRAGSKLNIIIPEEAWLELGS